MNALNVYLHDNQVGVLERLEQAKLRFTYSERAVQTGEEQLSISLPLRAEPFDNDAAQPYFGGLLPEGEFLRAVARAFGVSAGNAFAVLEAIGGECAGAVSLSAVDSGPPPQRPPRWLNAEELYELIESLPSRPLLADEDGAGLRLSLAGAQDKLPVVFGGGRVGITRGAPPSTHIIKLPDRRFHDMTANEAFCLALARKANLDAVEAGGRIASRTVSFEPAADDHEYLLVERYDRVESAGQTRRIHQEDLCQALGLVSEQKYEAGGGPGVAACAELLRRHSAAPAVDILGLLDALAFNFMIGNHDAHAKNYSLFLEGQQAPRLAPLYDLISTVVYEGLTRKMAMKLGGEYRPAYVRARHLARLGADLGMTTPATRSRLQATCERITTAVAPARDSMPTDFADRQIVDRVHDVVTERAKLLRDALAEM